MTQLPSGSTPSAAELVEAAREVSQVEALQAANRRLLRQLDEAKASKAELVAAVYQAAKDAAGVVGRPESRFVALPEAHVGEEVALAVLSDWQLGKVTPSYSSEVCRERVRRYADKVAKLVTIQRADHPVRRLKVALLGDLVEGELIFPGQVHRIDSSLFRQVLVDGPEILCEFLQRMASLFETVEVVGVIGNHGALGGRARKEYHPESNADAMMYEVCRLRLGSEPRIGFGQHVVSNERKWYDVLRIGAHGFLLFHGDQVRGGFAGFPWYGFGKRLQGWKMSLGEGFSYALSGHFHTPVRLYQNGITLWGNGSTESDNTYALEELSASGEPCQWLLFVSPEHGVTAEYLVHLNETETESPVRRVEISC